MGIHDKDPINKDRRDTHLNDEYNSPKKDALSEREVLEKRLFKHSEYKRPYDADDYSQMERNFTFPRFRLPSYLPMSPELMPIPGGVGGSAQPITGTDITNPPNVLDSSCDCGSYALSLQNIGIIPEGNDFSGYNNCGLTFSQDGFSLAESTCFPEEWTIYIGPPTSDAFLILQFSAQGYPYAINWSYGGAGGEFSTSYDTDCYESAIWRIPLKDFFKGETCGLISPEKHLTVNTLSPNCDGSICTGQQNIIVKMKVDEEYFAKNAFKVTPGGCGDIIDNTPVCGVPPPAGVWTFTVCFNGEALDGKDVFGTGQAWTWSASELSATIIPQDAFATRVIVTVSSAIKCTLNVNAQHPCGASVAPSDICLPIGGTSCGWQPVCQNGSVTQPNECPPGSGLTPPKIIIKCGCPDITRTQARWGTNHCPIVNSEFHANCQDEDNPKPDPLTDEYRACVCSESNSDNHCRASCPTVSSTCTGVFDEWSQCWKRTLSPGFYNCLDQGTQCLYIQEARTVERWGSL